jgi:hypothetical protein
VGLARAVSTCAIADTDGSHPVSSAPDESLAAEPDRPGSVSRASDKKTLKVCIRGRQ